MNVRVRKQIMPLALLAVIALGLSTATQAESNTEATETRITCYLDDLQAQIYPETEWTRENLLMTAVYEASSRNKLIKFEDVRYNETLPKSPLSTLEIKLHQWRRSHSGFYEFRGSATYYDGTGAKHTLGIISGSESSVAVFNGFDVRDAFENVVERAVSQALRKIEKLESKPDA